MRTFENIKERFIKMFGQLIKYGIVGVINTIITFVVFFVLNTWFGIAYTIANAIGYIAGFINSFLMNKTWTFKGKQTGQFRQFVRFTVVFGVCYFLQLGLVILLVEKLSFDENISQLIGMVLYTFIGFFLNKIFTFKND